MKRILITFAALFITMAALETLINQVALKGLYVALSDLWRAPEELGARAWLFLPIYAATATAFVVIYRKLSVQGWAEALLIGTAIGVLARFFYGYTNYIVLPIPHMLALLWFVLGAVECAVMGVIAERLLRRPTA